MEGPRKLLAAVLHKNHSVDGWGWQSLPLSSTGCLLNAGGFVRGGVWEGLNETNFEYGNAAGLAG